MSRWQVQLFGGLRLHRGDEVVTHFRTRAVDAIFAYLALHAGKEIFREKLINLAWPEAEEEAGRQNLRTALSSIRQFLGAETLDANRTTVRLIPEHFVVDVDEFRRTQNVNLYSGKFLEGMDHDWVLPFTIDLEEEYARAVLATMDRLPPDEARALGMEALRRDPGRLDLRAKLREFGHISPQRAAPYVVTSFIGRENELRELDLILASNRLVTLTGLGGSGKTRLAAELWRRKQPQAWFIALADLNDSNDIPEAIRQGLRLPSSAQRSAFHQVVAVLRPEEGLLVLDNFEHLIKGASFVTDLLTQCEHLRVLVTSQLTLGVSGEVEFPLGPLGSKTIGPEVVSESMKLFEERARAVLPSFAISAENLSAVAELCNRLDGFPLAVEIAAAKSRVFTPTEMLAQLDRRFEFLTRRGEESHSRHSSLRTALDWGFDRLSESDQALLTELSLFRGGFTLDAAAQICHGSRPAVQIETLLIQAWIERLDEAKPTRFRLLESIREYGAELLPPREREGLAQSHAAYYLRLAQACMKASFTPEEPILHRMVEVDIHNLDAAWVWLRENDPEGCLTLVQGLNWFWILKGLAYIGEARIKDAINRADQTPRRILTDAYHACGNFILFQGRHAEAEPWFWKANALAVEIDSALLKGLSLCQIAQVHAELGRHETAREYAEAGLVHLIEDGDDNWIGAGYVMVTLAANRAGDPARACKVGSQAIHYVRRGGYPWGLASALNEMAMACHMAGDYAAAREYQAESIAIKRASRAPRSLALSLADQAATLLALGETEDSKSTLQESLRILVSLDDTGGYPRLYGTAAELLLAVGNPDGAARALGTMLQLAHGRSPTYGERVAEATLRQRLGPESARSIERVRTRSLQPIIGAILAI